MQLLVDIGNTRLKWCLHHAGQCSVNALNIHISGFQDDLAQQWQALSYVPQVLAIANVNKSAITTDLIQLARTYWPLLTVYIARSESYACGVKNGYLYPDKLGVDRWLALIAAWQRFKESCCVIDCGSAMTLDWINTQGEHQGGMIAPGLRLMQQSLHHNTEQLPEVRGDYYSGIAQDTSAAISSGVMGAAIGLIEKSVREHPVQHLLLTGGDSPLISKALKYDFILEPDLVFAGLIQQLNAQPL